MRQMTAAFFPCLFAAVHLSLPLVGLPQSNELLHLQLQTPASCLGGVTF